ncbi:MAG: hypothetical protein EA426_17485 [Spirochaetaceae bacterium]|nr:MAG: hypothetical protein EA426_17485 [Spirochaetaceae bacterium]
MVPFENVVEPTSGEFLVGFTDLRAFFRVAKSLGSSAMIFVFMNRLAHTMDSVVTESRGRTIKYIGDGALIVHPGEEADGGIRNLMRLKDTVDAHMEDCGHGSRLTVYGNFGEVTIGPFASDRRLDIYGETVNRAAVAQANDRRSHFVITPEAFRRRAPRPRPGSCRQPARRRYVPTRRTRALSRRSPLSARSSRSRCSPT